MLTHGERDTLMQAKQILERRREAIFATVQAGMLAPRELTPAWEEKEALGHALTTLHGVLAHDHDRRAAREIEEDAVEQTTGIARRAPRRVAETIR